MEERRHRERHCAAQRLLGRKAGMPFYHGWWETVFAPRCEADHEDPPHSCPKYTFKGVSTRCNIINACRWDHGPPCHEVTP